MFAIDLLAKALPISDHKTDDGPAKLISFIIYFFFTIIFIVSFFTLKTDLAYFIFSAVISFFILLFNLILFIIFRCSNQKAKVSQVNFDSDENDDSRNDDQASNHSNSNNNIPVNVPARLYHMRSRLVVNGVVSTEAVYELIELGFEIDDIFLLASYCLEHPDDVGDDSFSQWNLEITTGPSCKEVFNSLFNCHFHFIHIIINFLLSFLSSFSMIYIIQHYYSSYVYKIMSSFILGFAHKSLICPIKEELYSTTLADCENSQTRCFSIFIMSVGLFFIQKYDIDYFYIDYFLFFFLLCMFFDISILWGFIGLPRTTIHWFFEFVNRYLFGFSGSTTFLSTILQFLKGAITTGGCCAFLYYKDIFWSRTICLFLSCFICKIELNATICLGAFIQSVIASLLFGICNYFFVGENNYNLIAIVLIAYYFIFEYLIPYFSSISPYIIVYVQLFRSNKILKYIRMSLTLVTAPVIIGLLLTDDCNYIIAELLIIHSVNRYLSEPYVFGLALLISRFALYYDFELTSNLPLNLLISLIIARKFFSILPLLYFREKLSIDYLDNIMFFNDNRIIKIASIYTKMLLFSPTNFFLIPAFIWSLITGSPINFFFLEYYLPQPSPPRSNSFWDYPIEKINPKEHPIESFVYFSYLNSFKDNLYNMIKNGQLGIVDEK